MTGFYERVGDGVFAIDTEYVRPRMDASHLIIEDGHAVFVDTGTYFSVPNLLAALAAEDLGPDSVDYIVLTHIHLDHAGGAGHLAEALPRARVLVHPRGAQHIVDPSILIAATKGVYGEARFNRDYGDILAVPAARVESIDDGRRIAFGSRTLEFVHTPGHALHHLCIVDRDAGEVFTGDTFGVSYREFDTAQGEFIFPTTTPTQFDPAQLHASVDRILAFRPTCAYLTHYGRVGRTGKLGQDLHDDIDAFVAMTRAAAGAAATVTDRIARITTAMFEHLSERLDAHGFAGGDAERHALLDNDVALNAAGLSAWLSRRAA